MKPERIDLGKSMKIHYYLIALGILVFDHITKWFAVTALANHRSIDIIHGYLNLSYVENTGVAFGLFDSVQSQWKPYILAAMAIIAIAVIIVYSLNTSADRKLLHLALGITIGGICGNFLDRIFRGYVVDFIEFHIRESFYWPNFNVADSAITIGVALLLIDAVKNPAIEKSSGQPSMDNQL
jgi:signal peptidase II